MKMIRKIKEQQQKAEDKNKKQRKTELDFIILIAYVQFHNLLNLMILL